MIFLNWKSVERGLRKNLPAIATAIGIGGFISAGIHAVYVTPKACKLIEQKKEELGRSLTKKEVVEHAWRLYIPSVAIAITSSACIIGGMTSSMKRNATLAAAYSLTETTFREYRNQVRSKTGEEKEKDIHKEAVKKAVSTTSVQNIDVIDTDGVLCLDSWTGRLFKIDLEKLKKTENVLNRILVRDGSVSLNDFYDEIGLRSIKPGYDLGWDVEKGLIELEYDSMVTEKGLPCLVISFTTDPYYPF